MELTEKEFFIPSYDNSSTSLLDYIAIKVKKELSPAEIPVRFVITNTIEAGYLCELSVLTNTDNIKSQNERSIFSFKKRENENTEKFNVVLLIPTGIGAEIGGHCGDGNVIARLIASACDILITHPNVVNASDINEMTENTLYVEGSIITRLLMGQIGLQRSRSNRILMLMDKHEDKLFNDEIVNAVSSARISLGIDCDVYEMDNIISSESMYSKSGRAIGKIEKLENLFEIIDKYSGKYDAIGLSTFIKVPDYYHKNYFSNNDLINPWGGIEAMLTHSIAEKYSIPCAHSPMMASREIMELEVGIVDPRKAPESASITYLHCILKGLHKSPRITSPDKGINIEIEVKGHGKRGNPYSYRETNPYSLMHLSAIQLFRGKSEDEILAMITDYFDENLNKEHFIRYCELIKKSVTKSINSEKATVLLANVYAHFGNNLDEDILFNVWKNKAFPFIAYTDADDYEIPEKILRSHAGEIDFLSLKRIKGYEFGASFCSEVARSKFIELDALTADEIKNLNLFLEFISEDERLMLKPKLDALYSERIINAIKEKAGKFEIIRNYDDFNNYIRLKDLANQLGEEGRKRVDEAINEIIVTRCSSEFKPELWVHGLDVDVLFEDISKIFQTGETQNSKRAIILSKLNSSQQSEMIKNYSENNSWESLLNLYSDLVTKEVALGVQFELSEVKNQIINKFSFNIYNCVDRLKDLISLDSINDDVKIQLRKNLHLEKDKLEVKNLLEIFVELGDFDIIKDENHLLELLEGKILGYNEMEALISFLTDNCTISLFREIVSNSIEEIPWRHRFELFKSCGTKLELAKVFLDEYYSIETDDSSYELNRIIEFLKKSNDDVLSKHFLNKFYKKLSQKYSIAILELAIRVNHLDAQKLSYRHLTFRVPK